MDISRPVQTRDGRKVRILCTDADSRAIGDQKNEVVVIGLVKNSDHEELQVWHANGRLFHSHIDNAADLINIPIKREGYIIVSRGSVYAGMIYDSYGTMPNPIPDGSAIVSIEWEEP